MVAKGSKNSVIANLKSRYIKAKIVSKDMKKASFKSLQQNKDFILEGNLFLFNSQKGGFSKEFMHT